MNRAILGATLGGALAFLTTIFWAQRLRAAARELADGPSRHSQVA